MGTPTPEVAAREVIRHWPSLPELAEFAERRHGFGDSDGGFGVKYPEDLDDYDRVVEGIVIPVGQVQLYGYWGPPSGYELLVPESLYLDVLSKVLVEGGHLDEAERVRRLLEG